MDPSAHPPAASTSPSDGPDSKTLSATKDKDSKSRKTSTGCWTCRSRRVKCDERRPDCLRCQRASLICEGYEIRLNWPQAHLSKSALPIRDFPPAVPPEASYSRRRAISPSRLPTIQLSEIANIFNDIEDHSRKTQELQRGPFSVFRPSFSVAVTTATGIEATTSTFSASDSYPTSAASSFPQVRFPRELHNPSKSSKFEQKSLVLSSSAGQARRQMSRMGERLDRASSLNSFTHLAEKKELMHHWVDFICQNRVVADNIYNPYRSIVAPAACAALWTSMPGSAAQAAVFHCICASAAFNSSQLNGDKRHTSIALYQEQIAINHMRRALVKHDERDVQLLHVAIFACLVNECITGRSARWKIHLLGGLDVLARQFEGGIPIDLHGILIQSYMMTTAVSNILVPPMLWSHLDQLSSGCEAFASMYGLTRAMVSTIATINTMRRRILPQERETLKIFETTIYQQAPRSMANEASESDAARMVQHCSHVWYLAILIYFQRAILKFSVSQVQDLVGKAFDHIEAVDKIGEDKNGCLFIWPWLVVVSESSDLLNREKAQSFFDKKRRHRLGNVEQAFSISVELWRRRSSSPNGNSGLLWQDVSEEPQYNLLPV